MAKYDPTHPALCLTGIIQTVPPTAVAQYTEVDETGLNGVDIEYRLIINAISTQYISDESVRESNLYNAIDIKTGDYVTDTNGEIVLRIKTVISKSPSSIDIILEDVDGISYRTYNSNSMAASSNVVIFELSENGLPVFAGAAANSFVGNAMDKLQSRFSIDEHDERFRFNHSSTTNLISGEIVTVDDYGTLVKHGTTGAGELPIGTVITTSRNGKSVYVKPFNKIVENYPDPSILTGSPGDIYYTDVQNPGKITTSQSPGSKAIYMHLRDSITTEVNSTSATSLPGSTDVILINNISVFDGTIGHSVSSSIDLMNMINAQTSATGVSSTASIANIDDVTDTAHLHGSIGEAVALLSSDSGATFTYPEFTISDGTTEINIILNPNNYGQSTVGYNGSTQFLVITAVEISDILNTEFESNGIDLVASTFVDPSKNYPFLKIQGQNSASIVITNISPDAFGTNFAGSASPGSISGLELNTPIGTQAFLKLLRADGGDILITGGIKVGNVISPSGGYINVNGFCSSSSGSPALVMMVEGSSDGGSSDVGVNVGDDHDMSPNTTNGNNSPTGLFITYTPFLGSKVEIRINGIDANLGDSNNYQTKSCYFSPDGFIVRDFNSVEAGDELYWNGTFVGFELDSGDDLDFIYQASASNFP
jgi:hypothetical protein